MAALETVVRHASDWIDWIDRSGWIDSDYAPRVNHPLQVRLDSPLPAGLRLHHKTGQSVLWRDRAGTLLYVLDGGAAPEDLEPPAEAAYAVSGTLVIIVLALGYYSWPAILIAAAVGLVAAWPLSYWLSRRIKREDPNFDHTRKGSDGILPDPNAPEV